METSFFTGFGHFCRFIIVAAIVVTSINATLREAEYFTIKSPNEQTQKLIDFRGESTKNKKAHPIRIGFSKKRRRHTLPQIAVPSAQSGLTSLFEMGRGEPRRNNHLKFLVVGYWFLVVGVSINYQPSTINRSICCKYLNTLR